MFECEYFAVNHSIPGCLAIAIHTGAGTVLHTGDIKLDQLPPDGRPTDLPGMSRLGDAGVDLFLCDSTNSEIPGVGPSESEVGPTLHRLMRGAEGRVIVACFASNVDRVQQIIDAAVALGRKVSFVGRSMVRNMGIARELGYLHVDDDDVIDIGAAEMMAPERVVLITTGTQGEPMAALSRMSRGEHRSITLTPGDLIVLSSSLIPGNEEAVFGVIDSLAKIGARVVTNAQARVHVSGHAYAGELLFLYNGVRPRNVMPVHGTWRMLRANAALAARIRRGAGGELVLAENGVSVDLVAGKANIAGAVPTGKMFVDGLITGDVGDATLGERLTLSSGFIAMTIVVRRGTGRPAAPAQLHSRGFSEDPKALEPALVEGGGGAGITCRRNITDVDPDRPGGASHRRQVGRRDVPPAADDRADGHRDLADGLKVLCDGSRRQIHNRRQRPGGQTPGRVPHLGLVLRRRFAPAVSGVLVDTAALVAAHLHVVFPALEVGGRSGGIAIERTDALVVDADVPFPWLRGRDW